jgi:hypothetical protein
MPGKCDQPGQKGTDLRLVQIYSQLAVENLTILMRDLELCLAINNLPSGETTYAHTLGFQKPYMTGSRLEMSSNKYKCLNLS